MIGLRRAAAFAASCLLVPLSCAAEDTIHVAFSERPPYTQMQADGSPAGLLGTVIVNAFKKAEIPVQWHNVPSNRQLLMVRNAGMQNCAIGWFWKKEREDYAKFTRPIYRDRLWVVLANDEFAERGYTTLEELTKHRDVRILVKDNYSYGALDDIIAQWQPATASSTALPEKMVQSIAKGAVDMMFMPEEEGEYIISHHPASQTSHLRLLHLKDMPHGPERYLMCSKAVPDDVIERLDKAITFR